MKFLNELAADEPKKTWPRQTNRRRPDYSRPDSSRPDYSKPGRNRPGHSSPDRRIKSFAEHRLAFEKLGIKKVKSESD